MEILDTEILDWCSTMISSLFLTLAINSSLEKVNVLEVPYEDTTLAEDKQPKRIPGPQPYAS